MSGHVLRENSMGSQWFYISSNKNRRDLESDGRENIFSILIGIGLSAKEECQNENLSDAWSVHDSKLRYLIREQAKDFFQAKVAFTSNLYMVEPSKEPNEEPEIITLSREPITVAVIGNVDSGKTTLVGVLSKGIPDDGRGGARVRVFNYPHEAENGRTSSIAHEIMGFDEKGEQVVPERFNPNKNKYWAEVVKKSKKIVTFLDLCGHEKYLKTTMFGLVGLAPDFSMIILGSNMGISRMTREHLGITLALKIPFFVVITKVDMTPENVQKETVETLVKLLKNQHVNRMPVIIKDNQDELVKCAENLAGDRICPIFQVSSVTGEGVDKLRKFMSLLTIRNKANLRTKTDPLEFDINENFMVPGVGIVVSGVVRSGRARLNQNLLLGPDRMRQYRSVTIKSIHVNRFPAEEASVGQFACFSIKPTKATEKMTRQDFRKGMILIDPTLKPEPTWEFDAEISILHHSTTIKAGYQAVMHCGVVRQAVNIVSMDKELLRTGDKGLVRFRFMYFAEQIHEGSTILLREGRTKILGTIARVIPETAEKKEAKKTEIKEAPKAGKELEEVKENENPQKAAVESRPANKQEDKSGKAADSKPDKENNVKGSTPVKPEAKAKPDKAQSVSETKK